MMETNFVIFPAKVRKKILRIPISFLRVSHFHYFSEFSLCKDNILIEFKTRHGF